MVIRITWGKLRAGAWNEFERTYRENVLTKGKSLKGLRGRWLRMARVHARVRGPVWQRLWGVSVSPTRGDALWLAAAVSPAARAEPSSFQGRGVLRDRSRRVGSGRSSVGG